MVKQGKLTVSANYNYNYNNSPRSYSDSYRENYEPDKENEKYLESESSSKSKGNFQYGNLEASYEIDTLRLLTVAFGMYGSSDKSNSGGNTIMHGADRQDFAYRYRTDNHGKGSWYSINGNIDYQRTSRKNKERMITLSYKINSQPQTNDSYNTYLDIEPDENKLDIIKELSLKNFHSDGKTNTMEQTFQVDYTTPIGKLHTIETGAKYIFRRNSSDNRFYEAEGASENYAYNENRSSEYRHLNHILSAYAGYTLKYKGFTFKPGLRYEQTIQEVKYLVGPGENFDSNFSDLVPSVSLGIKLGKTQNLRGGYNMRIWRPGIWNLNPYFDNQNPMFINQGNPNLKSEKSHSFDLSYSSFTSKFNINLSLRHSFNNNGIERISRLITDKDGEIFEGGHKAPYFGAKALIENFVETGSKEHPSKVDIGPINTMISSNYIDGTRFRLSGMTTAHFDKHWFLSGYGAYGLKDERWKYSGTVTYSFNKRDYVVWEFPKHYLSATYSYDVMSPMDKFLFTDKDNIFLSVKTTTVDQMSYMRDATINYELETLTGFGVKAMLRHRNDEPTGKLEYLRNDAAQTRVHDVTTSEASLTLRYAPGESFVNSKQRRVPVSLDAPIFTLTHAMGFKGVLGGDYNFNRTEASVWKRFWLPASWGKIDCSVKAGAEWNTVPFPLLILPEANLSYITQRETFNLINNMEFLNDRYASMSLSYDMNGKLFNRIPLIKNLKWREMFRVRALWGTLTDKNNPFKSNNPDLFRFPTRDGKFTSFVMDPKVPYVEASVGIYNIFKLLHVEYVHRFTYRDNPGINKNGIRFMVLMVF